MSNIGSPQVVLTIDTGTHSSTIHRLLVTPDGKSIITASMDKTIRVWDVGARKGIRKLLGEIGPDDNGSIGRIALDPQGEYLYVTARWPDADGPGHQPLTFLRVYSMSSGNLESVYRYRGNVADMALSADGKYLALCGDQPRRITLFDPQTILNARTAEPAPLAATDIDPLDQPRCLRIFQQADQIHVVCGSIRKRTAGNDIEDPDDDTPGSGMLCWYTLGAQGLQLNKSLRLIGPNAPLHMAVSDQYLVTNGERETGLMCYNLRGQFVQRITPKSSADSLPASITFSADGKRLIVGALDGRDPVRVRVYDATDGFSLLSEYTGHDAGAQVAGFLNDGTAVSAGGTHYEIHFWDAAKPQGEQKAVITGAGQIVYGVGLKDATQIGIGNTPKELDEHAPSDQPAPLSRAFDLHTFSVKVLESKEAGAFRRAVLQRDRQRLRRRNDDNLWLVHGLSRQCLTEAPDPAQPGETLWYDASTFGFTEHGTVITGDVDGDVRVALRDDKGDYKGLPWRVMPGHSAGIQDHAAQGDWLVTAGMDQTVALWYLPDVEQDTLAPLEPALKLFVSSDNEWVVWSASGYYAASLHGDRYVGYHVNQGERQEALFYPSDRFIKQLYRPDIIRAILVDGNEERALTRLGVPKPDVSMILPPVIELKGVTRGDGALTLNVEVRPGAQKSPLKRVWALCNDRFVWEDRSDGIANGGALTPTIPLQPGANQIKLLAESEFAKSNPLIVLADGGAAEHTLPALRIPWKAEQMQLTFGLTPPPGPDAQVQMRHAGEVSWTTLTPPKAANGQLSVSLAEGDNDIAVINGAGDRQPIASVHVNTNLAGAGEQLNDLTLSLVGGATKGDLVPATGSEQPPPNGTLYLLAVGVAKLQTPSGPFQNLHFADADAQAIYDQFTAQKQKAFQNVVARLLLNEQATRANIYNELDALKATIDADVQARQAGSQATRDVFLVYMSGHGLIRSGEFYFWNYDYDDTHPSETGISFMELGDRITNVPAELIVMTDACQSGQGGTDLENAEAAELAKRLIAISERAQVVLNGTTRDTQSIEHESIQHGLFTYCILDGLKKLSQSPNGVLILELGGYVQEWVPYYTQRFAQPQVPTLRIYGELLPLCVYKA
jgi:WD40 repeat protein